MTAPNIYIVPEAYKDPQANAAAKGILQKAAWAAVDYAMAGQTRPAQGIMLDWALHCSEVRGDEARLVTVVKGASFGEAYLAMNPDTWNSEVFRIWFGKIYRDCAEGEQKESPIPFLDRQNNRAAWGIYGMVLADIIMGADLSHYPARITRKLEKSIGSDGTMKIEVLRTNMGMWYSCFDLSAMLRTCQLLAVSIGMDDQLRQAEAKIRKALEWLWPYIQDPSSWPYRPGKWPVPWWPWPKLEQSWHPTSGSLEVPRANDIGGSLYLAAGRVFGVQEWVDWAEPWDMGAAPFPGVNVFRWQR